MKRHAPSRIAVHAIAILSLILTAVFASAAPSAVGAQTTPDTVITVKSLTCEVINGKLKIALLLTGPATEIMWVYFTSDHQNLLWVSSGGTEVGGIMPGGTGYTFNDLDFIFPYAETGITIYADYGTDRVSCATVLPALPTPTPEPTQTATLVGPTITNTSTLTGTPPTATPTSTPRPTRTPTVAPPPVMRTIHTQTGSRAGGQSKVTVCMNRVAPAGGWLVTITSDQPSVFPVPTSVTIPVGHECLSLVINVTDTNRVVVATIAATYQSSTVSGTTTVRPSKPVVYTQTVSRAGGSSKITVCMVGSAPTGGTVVLLASDHPEIFPVAASVSIPAGKGCLSIVVPVGQVTDDATVTITADFGSEVKSGATIVRPL